jgi:subtilisin family serine protease
MADPVTDIPAWGLADVARGGVALETAWPYPIDVGWAHGSGDGAGARVCVVDSGIDGDHPRVNGVQRSVVAIAGDDDQVHIAEDTAGDASGHGTACAGIIRELAPRCELGSVRVLGPDLGGTGAALVAGLEWAIDAGYHVINLSLSTRRRTFADQLRELADRAYFRGALLVCSAHNLPVESFPWRFASVLSVAAHDGTDGLEVHYNPRPPVEFYGRGVDVHVAWQGGGFIRATGNSFATPHLSGICARILGAHPTLTPFQVKSVLYLTAANVRAAGTPGQPSAAAGA